MKKLKVLLVGINSKFVHTNLAIRYLKAYTKDLDYDAVIMEFSINDRVERILEDIIVAKPDIIAFSCYIWNSEIIKQLSKVIKLVNEKIEILYGGPEASFEAEKFLQENNGDYLIEGEGEETFRKFIQYKIAEKTMQNNGEQIASSLNIGGLYYRKEGKIVYGGPKDYIDINKVVFPYDQYDDLENKIVYYEASRGCPFRCKYCLSSVDRNVRFRDIEKVKEELTYFINKKVRLVKFVDRTFNCNEDLAIAVWSFLIQAETGTKFHFEISADILSDKCVKVLSKAPKGRFQFEVGVQTTNNEVLKNINRYVKFDNIATRVKQIKELNNINQHLDLIAGLPGEDLNSFINSFNEVYSIKPEELQLGFLKILKGSPMMVEKDKWQMKYSPYPPYEILKTKDISYEELLILKKVEAVVDKYYNSGKFKTILKYFEMKFDAPFDFYYSLGMFCEEKKYFSRNISNADYYKIFLEFNSEILKEDNEALKDIIKFDYLLFNKKKWLPEFLDREVDKKITKELKEKVLEANKDINTKNISIEKFNIDILHFIKTSEILYKITYLAYDNFNENKYFEITL